MPYATQSDLISRWSEDEVLVVADRDRDNVIDAAVVTAALQSATDEIDGYVRVKHILPLPSVPGVIKDLCCDVAMYNLSLNGAHMTDDKGDRYEKAIKTLEKISAGKFDLGFDRNPSGVRGAVVVTGTRPRIFSRDAMGNL